MASLIDAYFRTHLPVAPDVATRLHQRYYRDYGLALEGLVRHHQIDPLAYNAAVDDALPLEELIALDPRLRRLIESIDRRNVRLWLFTNAYVHHARRVVRLLGVDDLFDGITYCDYASPPLLCKPAPAMYAKAMREACVTDCRDVYFVDDSALNAKAGKLFGWRTAHLVEPCEVAPPEPVADYQIESLYELPSIFGELFKKP